MFLNTGRIEQKNLLTPPRNLRFSQQLATVKTCRIGRRASCLYRASVTIKTLYYPTDAQIYNS